MPFNVGPIEMIFIAVVLLLLFGAKRLPELGSGLGKGIREFKHSMREINTELDRPPEQKPNQIHSAQRPAVGTGSVESQLRSEQDVSAESKQG
jgi:sec-independent protein translocase protein TatA